jgi:hypothetical protein
MLNSMTFRVLPRTVLDFSGLQASGQIGFPIGQHIDASAFTEADLLVRLHGPTTSGGTSGTAINSTGGGNFVIALAQDGYDFEEPATPFFPGGSITGSSPGAVSVTTSTAVPSILTATLNGALSGSAPLGRFLACYLLAAQGTTAGANLRLAVSIDIIFKGGDPGSLPMAPNAFRGYRVM